MDKVKYIIRTAPIALCVLILMAIIIGLPISLVITEGYWIAFLVLSIIPLILIFTLIISKWFEELTKWAES